MAISNTSLLIKRSTATSSPGTLKAGELAYSYVSNTLFLGTSGGNGVVNVGGLLYTQTIDAATNLNTAGTLVKRDASGNFVANTITASLNGNANTATYLQNPQNFSITGGDITATAVSFGGNNPVALNASLNAVTGLTAGYYGGATQGTTTIPVIQVAANGRVMSISNTTATSSFNISDGTTSNTIYSGATFYHQGTGGITTTVTNNTVTFGTNTTIARTNTAGIGVQSIGTDLTISGNLTVTGTTTYVNTAVVQTADSLLQLAINNTVGDVVDIGFTGQYNSGSANLATGLVRDAGNKQYYLFSGVSASSIGTANTIANNLFTTANTATLNALLVAPGVASFTTTANVTNDLAVGGNIYASKVSLASANTSGDIGVGGNGYFTGKISAASANTTGDVGVGGNIYATGKFVAGASSNVTGDLAVTGNEYATNFIGTKGVLAQGIYNGAYTDGTVVDYNSALSQGRISVGSGDGLAFFTGGVGTTPIMNLSSSGVITVATWQGATVGVPYGGTGQTSFNAGQIIVGNGTGGLAQIANVSTTVTGSLATNNTITSVTTDAWGRLTAYTGAAISGLTVPQGGTGLSTITQNGITYGNGAGNLGVTAAAGTADQAYSNQILTVTNAGVPVWSTSLDGGTF
jgi:hypothetical protein